MGHSHMISDKDSNCVELLTPHLVMTLCDIDYRYKMIARTIQPHHQHEMDARFGLSWNWYRVRAIVRNEGFKGSFLKCDG